ncbi:hypothetical protein D3C73_893880 [compost metagenome]
MEMVSFSDIELTQVLNVGHLRQPTAKSQLRAGRQLNSRAWRPIRWRVNPQKTRGVTFMIVGIDLGTTDEWGIWDSDVQRMRQLDKREQAAWR